MPNKTVLHLALGDSAGGCLRAAISSFGLPGRLSIFSDDLSHGPLNSTRARTAYFKTLFGNYGQMEEVSIATMDDFEALSDQLEQDDISEICVWAGENASERTFLEMACHYLDRFKGSLTRVGATGLSPVPYIAPHSPEALAALFSGRETVAPSTQASLSADYLCLRDKELTLRRWDVGKIIDVAADYYDPLLLACCPPDWTFAARVVGTAMGRCEDHNMLSDVFLSSRLQHLVAQNAIEALGPQTSLRDYKVRRK